jgi:hypothetical protein
MTLVDEVRAVYRWYFALCYGHAARVTRPNTAARAAAYACSTLFGRAILGRPTQFGPHQYADAQMWFDLTHNAQMAKSEDLGRWMSCSVRLSGFEPELLCVSLGKLYTLGQAAELGPLARLTVQDAAVTYDPLRAAWLDGFTHVPELQLISGALHRIELAMDDPDAPAADWERLGREYADGELHRHLGWTQAEQAKEVETDGQQAAEVRDRRVPDQARADDQVEGQRADRQPVPSQGSRPGPHDADAHDD